MGSAACEIELARDANLLSARWRVQLHACSWRMGSEAAVHSARRLGMAQTARIWCSCARPVSLAERGKPQGEREHAARTPSPHLLAVWKLERCRMPCKRSGAPRVSIGVGISIDLCIKSAYRVAGPLSAAVERNLDLDLE